MTVQNSNQAVTITPPGEIARKPARIVDGDNEAEMQKDMFLKLMIAQLKNQDPTAPMDQKDMMASITQFSQVEQMQKMTQAMETLSLAQGVNMVGNFVDYRYQLKNEDGSVEVDEIRSGKVISVEQKAGAVELMLTNGVRVKPADVTSVSEVSRPPQSMMGKYVDFQYVGTNAAGEAVPMVLTGKVTSIIGQDQDAQLFINGRTVDPDDVITVSNIPRPHVAENPPAGVT